MKKRAVFPGSFDPFTRGHENVILRALPLFDEIIIAIGINAEKKALFQVDQRLQWIKQVFAEYPQVKVESFTGLTVDFCKQVNASYILRGLRTSADFEFERSIGQINKQMYSDIETVFFLTLPQYTALTSSIVRDIIRNGGDASAFVPDAIAVSIKNYKL